MLRNWHTMTDRESPFFCVQSNRDFKYIDTIISIFKYSGFFVLMNRGGTKMYKESVKKNFRYIMSKCVCVVLAVILILNLDYSRHSRESG